MIEVTFPEEGVSPAADSACALVAGGFLSAVSVGFRILEARPLDDGRGAEVLKAERFEVSIVNVPSNPSALLEGKQLKAGRSQLTEAELRSWVEAAVRPALGLAPERFEGTDRCSGRAGCQQLLTVNPKGTTLAVVPEGEDGREVQIRFEIPEGFRTVYATNLVVQHTEHEFLVMFFEVIPPPFVGTPEMKRKQLAAIEDVRATCLARIVVSPSRMEEVIQVLTDNLNSYKASQARSKDQAEERAR